MFCSIGSIQSHLVKPKITNQATTYLMLAGGGSLITDALSSSYDGINWYNSNTVANNVGTYFPFLTHQINTLATNGTILVAGCHYSGKYNIIYSYDGILWNVCKTTVGANITSTFMAYCYCIAFNPNSYNELTSSYTGMFVATGQLNNSIAYSWDGITWASVSSSLTLFTSGMCIDYIGTYWIIGANGGNNWTAYSNDGKTWTGMGKPSIMNASGISGLASCRTNSLSTIKWVACGTGTATIPTVMYATDVAGTAWSVAYMGGVQVYNTILVTATVVSYNGSVWIVGGTILSSTSIATSPDGQNWTRKSVTCGTIQPNGITNDGSNNWIAVGISAGPIATNSNIIVSIDNGSTWIQRGLLNAAGYNGPGSGPLYSPCFFKNAFIIGGRPVNGYNQSTVTSLSKPINTSPLVGLATSRGHTITSIATNGTNIVFSAYANNQIATSTDKGITWITPSVGTVFGQVYSVIWSSAFNVFITLCTNTYSIYTSPDGIIWTVSTISLSTLINSQGVRAMVASDPSGVTLNSGATAIVATVVLCGYSTNKIIITPNPLSTTLTDWVGKGGIFSGITFNGIVSIAWSPVLNLFVAAGASSTGSYIVTSSDNGITWITRSSAGLSIQGYAVCWSPSQNKFVVGGGNNTMVWSSDGQTWNNCITTGLSFTGISSIIWNASLNKWFATGWTNIIITSLDGITWTLVTQSVFNATDFRSCIQVLPVF